MRISDWSSDVCSSDLAGNSVRKAALSHPARLQETATMNPHRRHAGHAAPGRPLRGLYLLTPDDDDTARLLERARAVVAHRSDERRVGKEWVSPCRSRWSAYH